MSTPNRPEMPEMPEITSMAELAAAVHELYLSYVGAGFSKGQAFELVKIHAHALAIAAGAIMRLDEGE